jgi:hypothetical protein
MTRDELDNIPSLDNGTPEAEEAMASIREAIRNGKFVFSEEAKQQMRSHGFAEEEVIEMIIKKVGLDS